MTQLAVRDTDAAKMLSMSPQDFRRLVNCGALPGPVRIGEFTLWRVDDLRAALDGRAAKPTQEFEL